jgi:hypothetical protein
MAHDAQQLASVFLDGEVTMYPACVDDPEAVWQAIIQLSREELTDRQTALLAAGPLEDLLARHGAAYIERVETEARQRPKFRHLLGGVWRSSMPEEVWERVTRARGRAW